MNFNAFESYCLTNRQTDIHTCIHTDRLTHTAENTYHAASRVIYYSGHSCLTGRITGIKFVHNSQRVVA